MSQIDDLYPSFSHPAIRHVVWLQDIAAANNLMIRATAHSIDFIRDNRIVRIGIQHLIYSEDIIRSFDYYYSAVRCFRSAGFDIVDYSVPSYHDVVGFELMPVHFPSFCEPIITTNQYLDFADLADGGVVIDLGAYSGLTSIIFKELVGDDGRVVAVDADEKNLVSLTKNFALYTRITGRKIDVFEGALWDHDRGISFSSEGNMGASAVEIVGGNRGDIVAVPSITLTGLALKYDLPRVDFIKCDIEGAEAVVFRDHLFFERFRPKIIIETHPTPTGETTASCVETLSRYGYSCESVVQHGVVFPLLQCIPLN